MSEASNIDRSEVLALSGEIVAAYVSRNALAAKDLPAFIETVFERLSTIAGGERPAPVELTPAVPIKKSVTDEYIVCLEDGKKLKMLKRHLMAAYGMTPEAYRTKWGLPGDYPMVAPAYARSRQDLAIKIGLGRKKPAPAPAPKARGKAAAAKGAAKPAAARRPARGAA